MAARPQRNVMQSRGMWPLVQFVTVTAIYGLLLFVRPGFAGDFGATGAIAIGWIDVIGVAYLYGTAYGLGAVIVAAVLNLVLAIEPGFVLATLAMQIAVTAALGRLRQLSRLLADQQIEHQRAQLALDALALQDPLTKLANRTQLMDLVAASLVRGSEAHRPVALLFVNLDRFKDVNDGLGHHWGDEVLCIVAERLKAIVTHAGTVARLGSDEFGIVLPDHGVDEAIAIGERIVTTLSTPYSISGHTIVLGASVGVAVSADDKEPLSLLRRADVAMGSAKRRGSGLAVYSVADDKRVQSRVTMASLLYNAIAGDQLVLHYQPQVSLRDGRVRSVEALLRWQHPERGLLLPGAFLPIAEEIGMMGRLTDWVLRAALRQVKSWNRAGIQLRVSVNLSAVNLREPRLADTINDLLALYDVAPEWLCIELTETAVTTEAERSAALLRRISDLDVRISIDDFGTGYSSLAHLKLFPVDELKIDRSFVSDMDHDAEDAAIVASTIGLAHSLNLDVVVEGVEKPETWNAIAKLGADAAQGFLIAPGLSVDDLEAWLAGYDGLDRMSVSA